MTRIDVREVIVLAIAVLAIVLGLFVGPAVSETPVVVWVPVGIGILLLVQWAAMRRKRRAVEGG